ncbi:MAG: class I SAM-dependent methyltransferase [Pyrinomonadaceae bacterium]
MNEFLENNRSLWNGWTAIHARSKFYDVESFKAGKSSLQSVELEEVGGVAGKSLLHLQCHFGMDTLSWARLGARATGVDFSDEAIKLARALAAELNLPAEFVCSNLYELPRVLDAAGRFHIVYTSYGVLSWLPDLKAWAEVIAHFLKPGGAFHLVEYHPLVMLLGDDGATFEYPYFHSDEPLKLHAQGSYADPQADFSHTEYGWVHSFSDIINALLGANLHLEYVHEFPFAFYKPWPFLEEEAEGGKSHMKDRAHDIPLMFSLRAVRAATD